MVFMLAMEDLAGSQQVQLLLYSFIQCHIELSIVFLQEKTEVLNIASLLLQMICLEDSSFLQ